MKASSTSILLLGGALFVVGAVCLLLWMEGHGLLFARLGAMGLALSLLLLTFGAWRQRRTGRDPLEVRREQRLWRSGPLGRRWLRIRKRLF